jgi:hypothetical protein
MSPAGTALAHELQVIRAQARGRHLQAVATFGCENLRCAVDTVRIAFVESDESLPAQAPMYCCRCRQELTRYIGIQRRS